ncbi:MAG: 30S ribosome-binding factor RbfA [Deltaproteobacteria bacterium]|jgi:ribosome-binding factor A|nr:30S ribosome-binding factor RbfA [Deltaproteobacteria bacterium]
MSQRRLEKVNHQILTQVAELLLLRSEDPRLKTVSVTRAEVSPDLRKAKVFWSVLGDEDQKKAATKALTGAAGFIRSSLAGTLGLRAVPELSFIFDKNLEYAQKLNQVFDELQPAAKGPKSSKGQPKKEAQPPLEDLDPESDVDHAAEVAADADAEDDYDNDADAEDYDDDDEDNEDYDDEDADEDYDEDDDDDDNDDLSPPVKAAPKGGGLK